MAVFARSGLPCPGVPRFTAAGVTNGASFVSGVTPGGIITIFGTSLTKDVSGIVVASRLPLAVQLAGTSVTVNDIPAPLFAVVNVAGNEQINLQVPWEVAGQSTATFIVNNNGLTSGVVRVSVLPAHPGVFAWGANLGVVQHANGQLVTDQAPAAKGEVLIIYATGLGAVSPASPTGDAAGSGANLSRHVTLPVVTIGGINAAVEFSGLTPGFVGLCQVNVRVPSGAPSGSLDLVVKVGDQAGKPVKLAVQ